MKKRILLVDDSLTVQKVVALTLDKNKFAVSYARSKAEATKIIVESQPDLVLVSDQVSDINVGSFPKEVEAWLGGDPNAVPCVLITGQDIREYRHYAGVLKKPFSPQALLGIINEFATQASARGPISDFGISAEEFEDQRLQKAFNDAFSDEPSLVRETFESSNEDSRASAASHNLAHAPAEDRWEERAVAMPKRSAVNSSAPSPSVREELWTSAPSQPAASSNARAALRSRQDHVMGAGDSMAYKANLEEQVEAQLSGQPWEELIDRALSKILPPIVERMVQERLNQLLKEHEEVNDAL